MLLRLHYCRNYYVRIITNNSLGFYGNKTNVVFKSFLENSNMQFYFWKKNLKFIMLKIKIVPFFNSFVETYFSTIKSVESFEKGKNEYSNFKNCTTLISTSLTKWLFSAFGMLLQLSSLDQISVKKFWTKMVTGHVCGIFRYTVNSCQ